MHYDPILCMNVEDTVKTKDSMTFSIDVRGMDDRKVSRLIGEAQNLGFVTGDTGYTITLRGNGDVEKLKRLFPGLKLKTSNADSTKDSTLGSVEEYYNRMVGKNKSEVEKIVASAKGNPNADLAYKKWKAVNAKDAVDPIQRRKHEIVVKTENYLRSIGKNNSVGKFDRVVQGVKNLLYQGFLEGPELDRAIKQEADRLIKKYNLNDSASIKDASPIPVTKVIETKGKYSIIQDDRGLYWVTIDKTGHGGGTAEVNLSNARRTLEHYMLMDKLKAKYGEKEGYKRYIAGETDECPEGMTCDKMFNSGDKYTNENGAKVVITHYDKEGQVGYTVNGTAHRSTEESLSRMLKVNGYTKDEKAVDKAIKTCDTEFPSEKEAIEYCKENGIDPHNIKPIGDKFVVNDKKSVLDKAIRSCDVNYKAIAEEADKLFHGKYGWITNISDIETAINDATRRGNLADAKKLKQLKLKYDK